MTKARGITSVEKWLAAKSSVKVGGIAPGTSTPDNATRILKTALGLPVQLAGPFKRDSALIAKLTEVLYN